jgi:hypothetical protein
MPVVWASAPAERRPGMGRHPAPQPSRLSRWLRGLWPDRNPLRRASDRMEAAVVAWLAAALLVGVPLAALSAGRLSYDAGVSAEHAQQAWRQVPAVLPVDAPDAAPDGPARAAGSLADWTAPDGAQRVGRVPAPPDARAGTVLGYGSMLPGGWPAAQSRAVRLNSRPRWPGFSPPQGWCWSWSAQRRWPGVCWPAVGWLPGLPSGRQLLPDGSSSVDIRPQAAPLFSPGLV